MKLFGKKSKEQDEETVVCSRCQAKETRQWYESGKKRAKSALKYAKNMNANSFYQSCKKFFDTKGYLTDRQMEALENQQQDAYNSDWDF